ncbi:hypothetical protein OK016_14975 [Vibrio chagasii]|nr:hypothetical protein [Vibrio chagasii]
MKKTAGLLPRLQRDLPYDGTSFTVGVVTPIPYLRRYNSKRA